jgi:hypothetical protein
VIRLIYGVGERVDDVLFRRIIVGVADGFSAELRSDLARRMATHAVAYHKKRATILEDILFLWHAVCDVILITFALATHIGEFGHREAELLCHQSFLRLPTSTSGPVVAGPRPIIHLPARKRNASSHRGTPATPSRRAIRVLLCITSQKAKRDSSLLAHPHTRF